MSFWLHGAPSTFQQLMDHILWLHGTSATIYLDNVVMYSSNLEDDLNKWRPSFEPYTQPDSW